MSFYWRWLAALGFVVVFLDIVLLAGFDTPHWVFDLLFWGAAGYNFALVGLARLARLAAWTAPRRGLRQRAG